MDFASMYEFFMRELRLMHSPVGMKFIFDEEELEAFRVLGIHHTPTRPLTFCQAELGARMEGITVLLEPKKLWCTDARCVFGIDGVTDEIVSDLGKFSESPEQARRFAESKPRMERSVLGVVLSPLRISPCSRTLCTSAVIICRHTIWSMTGWLCAMYIPSGLRSA